MSDKKIETEKLMKESIDNIDGFLGSACLKIIELEGILKDIKRERNILNGLMIVEGMDDGG